MKFFLLLSFNFFVLLKTNGQDCEKLGRSTFSELKFGSKYPSGPLAACAKTGNVYHLDYDSLDENCKKKYSALFKFLSLHFSHLIIRTNKNGEIYSIELWTVLKRSDWKDSANTSPPPEKFAKLQKKLETSYGKATDMENEISSNPFVKKIDGVTRRAGWECTDLRLRMRVTYASEVAEVNVLSVEIKDPGFEIVGVLGESKNDR